MRERLIKALGVAFGLAFTAKFGIWGIAALMFGVTFTSRDNGPREAAVFKGAVWGVFAALLTMLATMVFLD